MQHALRTSQGRATQTQERLLRGECHSSQALKNLLNPNGKEQVIFEPLLTIEDGGLECHAMTIVIRRDSYCRP